MKRLMIQAFILNTILIAVAWPDKLWRDLGIGMIYIQQDWQDGKANPDTLVVHEDMDLDSPVIAEYIFNPPYDYQFQSEHADTANLLEFGYETQGFPFHEMTADSNWVRIIFGIKNGTFQDGWVQTDLKKRNFFFWRESLLKSVLYFDNNVKIRSAHRYNTPDRDNSHYGFYDGDGPNGNKVEFDLEPGTSSEKYNYIMHPIRTEGRWMEVRVVTPSDYCDQPANPKVKVLWIKFLDERGRPMVWYYTRGC